jgi:hypothetical protein
MELHVWPGMYREGFLFEPEVSVSKATAAAQKSLSRASAQPVEGYFDYITRCCCTVSMALVMSFWCLINDILGCMSVLH